MTLYVRMKFGTKPTLTHCHFSVHKVDATFQNQALLTKIG